MQDTSELTAALTDCEDGADFSCDFLVKGSGSMGCGFTDALIAEDSAAQVKAWTDELRKADAGDKARGGIYSQHDEAS